MVELIYISRATERFDEEELTKILNSARTNNQKNHITGLLLYDGRGTFIQALEGPESEIENLFDVIKADTRHTNVNKIGLRHIETRGI